jgi:OOP family OmpA-OmpF porin
MSPVVERALTRSVRRNPQPMADALFPVMGPAIRRAISQALAGMMQNINQALEHTLSPRSVAWRWEAFRTGTSFAEVAMRHSLVYRVEQAFLVHRESGLLLQHVHTAGSEASGRDMVAGMLTAIQDFARDSFGVAQEEMLETMQVGELTVWLEQGGHALLAAVIRGHAPLELRGQMQTTLENIEAHHAEDLAGFKGDTGPFAASLPALEALLRMEARSSERTRRPLWGWLLVGLIAVLLLAWLGQRYIAGRRWDALLAALRNQPGVIVTQAERSGSHFLVRGLRDPLAPDPAVLIAASRLDSAAVDARWEPYVALVPTLIVRRAAHTLAAPVGITLNLVGDTLVAAGVAAQGWFDRAAALAPALPGVGHYRAEAGDPRTHPALAPAVEAIEAWRATFATGSASLGPGADSAVRLLAAQMAGLDTAARALGIAASLTLLGSADDLGAPGTNQWLRLARATEVRARLLQVGLTIPITVAEQPESADPAATEEERAARRTVVPRVGLDWPQAAAGVTP